MISGDIKAAGAGEDNRDLINARNTRSNNAAAETAYFVFTFQLNGVVTAVFAEPDCLGRATTSTGDVNAFEGEETAIICCLFVEVGTSATGDGRFLVHNSRFASDENIRVGGGLGDFYILISESFVHWFWIVKRRSSFIHPGLEGEFIVIVFSEVVYCAANGFFAFAGFSGDFCVVARNGEATTLNGIGFTSIVCYLFTIFVGSLKLCAIGNGDVAIYFNCRGIIRIYCVHRCTLTCNNKVFRCSNPIAVSIFVCVVGAKISIYCDATLNGDITTLICFKRRTISVFALDVKSAPLIACDNEVYLILG